MIHDLFRGTWTAALPALLCLLVTPVWARADDGKKYALLVGINAYDSDKLPPLHYAVNDAAEAASVLQKNGYEVILLTDEVGKAERSQLPTRGNIDSSTTCWAGTCLQRSEPRRADSMPATRC